MVILWYTLSNQDGDCRLMIDYVIFIMYAYGNMFNGPIRVMLGPDNYVMSPLNIGNL